jgi:hypothetical protein
MTNNENNNNSADKSGDNSDNLIAMSPQNFLEFLGHITHATVISAVTCGSMGNDLQKIIDLLKEGDHDQAVKDLEIVLKQHGLVTSVICKLGHELTQHDQAVVKSCQEKGLDVHSITETHIDKFQENTKDFIDSFFKNKPKMSEDDKTKTDKKTDKKKNPFGDNPRFKNLGGFDN